MELKNRFDELNNAISKDETKINNDDTANSSVRHKGAKAMLEKQVAAMTRQLR